ncbi:MAG: hypothetical protein IJ209_05180 [Bacteroidaceae bacterium]|nr:hypothetical protein [Bacteroidaceae bacterium]
MKNHYLLTHILSPVFLGVCFFGCTGGRQYRALLEQADSLMATYPDSAYALLNSIDSVDLHSQRKSVCMRYELLRAEAQNKLLIPFTTDSVLREVVRYYDRHCSSNQQLKARYLLGCTYRDLHEAPIALLTWEDAIAAADTTAADCDYATLFRVYGQMADVYFRQYMPERELHARDYYCKYALQAGDTLNYIKGLLKMNDAYLSLGDTISIFANIEKVKQFCMTNGLDGEMSQCSLMAIRLSLDNNEFLSAGEMMKLFEQKSGLFDNNGNITLGQERYYYDKGRYFAGIGLLDSAENQFRRLLPYEDCLIDACHGLLFLFQYQARTDSILKYTLVYEQALASYLSNTRTTAIAQSAGMYDYSRQERIAQKRKLQLWLTLVFLVPLALAAAILVVWLLYKKRSERRKFLNLYKKSVDELFEAKRVSQLLRQALSKKEVTKKLLDEKDQEVQQLEEVVAVLQNQLGASGDIKIHQQLSEAEIIQKFHDVANPYITKEKESLGTRSRAATQKEWAGMKEVLTAAHPQFFLFLQKHKLSDLKTKVCILSYLGFDNTEIATLTGANPGSITNARTAIARDLFNLTSARNLNRCLIEIESPA